MSIVVELISNQNLIYPLTDIVLHCIGLDLELHSTVLKRSVVLCELLGEALQEDPTETTYYKSSVNAALDSLVQSAGQFYRVKLRIGIIPQA